MKYNKFLENKEFTSQSSGIDIDIKDINTMLFEWQKSCDRWALKKGRAALFEFTGAGKSFQQLEWARIVHSETKKDILILAPLAVSKQTKREGKKFNIDVTICKTQDDVKPGINITNYQKLHHFDTDHFVGIVLDESSILKGFQRKTRNELIERFKNTPYRLCCTATPSPNDYAELGNTAEFLGIMTYSEMLSMFFINDTGDTTANWRLKGHVKDNVFWKWLSTWSLMINKPEDIGFNGDNFILPKLNIIDHVVPGKLNNNGFFFVQHAKTLSERREARKNSLNERVKIAADLVNNSNDIFIIWCDLNIESELLKKSIKDCVEVKGSDSDEHKEKSILDFSDGKIKCLITKPSIAGHGVNWQICHNQVFVGLSDSFEQYYQAVRRCWRFGQTKEVNIHRIYSEEESNVIKNLERKEFEMEQMRFNMIKHMQELMKSEIKSSKKNITDYNPKLKMKIPGWLNENN